MPDTRVMELPDGRELAWLETGKPRGFPVFAFQGTPGSRPQVSFDPTPHDPFGPGPRRSVSCNPWG